LANFEEGNLNSKVQRYKKNITIFLSIYLKRKYQRGESDYCWYKIVKQKYYQDTFTACSPFEDSRAFIHNTQCIDRIISSQDYWEIVPSLSHIMCHLQGWDEICDSAKILHKRIHSSICHSMRRAGGG